MTDQNILLVENGKKMGEKMGSAAIYDMVKIGTAASSLHDWPLDTHSA